MKHYSINLDKTDRLQYLVGFLCLFVYTGALFFPLMDKDAAHHANIALRMLEHGDYASLVDRQLDYLDKPHFLFWSSALSFKIFGVNTFAHRLPAILFALVTVYSTYKLAKHLSGITVAKLAAGMLATSLGFILSINDARMETPLTAGIIFGLWQLIVFIDKRTTLSLVLAALGAAIAFSTKGWIGVMIIFVAAFFYILSGKKWKLLGSPKTWLFIPFFFLFISPVLYAYYLQYDLHPEKVIRGMTRISGIKFILWDQNFERFKGDGFVKGGRNSSVFFLYHTFLWAFFPWCFVAYMGLFFWLRRIFFKRKWNNPFNFAALAFGFILFSISFSKFKMPHYIFMLMPLAALFTAPYLRLLLSYRRPARFFYGLHVVIAVLIVTAGIILNYHFFKPFSWLVHITGPVFILGLLYFIGRNRTTKPMKLLYVGAGSLLLFSFFLNYNFFPNLFRYQGGNELVSVIREQGIQIDDRELILLDNNAHTFDFYRGYNHDVVEPTRLTENYDSLQNKFFLLNTPIANELIGQGFRIDTLVSHPDYNVSTLKLKFLNPATRWAQIDTLMIGRIYR